MLHLFIKLSFQLQKKNKENQSAELMSIHNEHALNKKIKKKKKKNS